MVILLALILLYLLLAIILYVKAVVFFSRVFSFSFQYISRRTVEQYTQFTLLGVWRAHVPCMAGTTSKEPWRSTDLLPAKGMVTCNASQARMVSHTDTLQDSVNNRKTPDQNHHWIKRCLKHECTDCEGIKTQWSFHWGFFPRGSLSCCITIKILKRYRISRTLLWETWGQADVGSLGLSVACAGSQTCYVTGFTCCKGAPVPALKFGVVQVGLPDCHQNGQMGEFL